MSRVNAPAPAILWMPQGSGKSSAAEDVAKALGCTAVVDEWAPGLPMTPGALHLSNVIPGHSEGRWIDPRTHGHSVEAALIKRLNWAVEDLQDPALMQNPEALRAKQSQVMGWFEHHALDLVQAALKGLGQSNSSSGGSKSP